MSIALEEGDAAALAAAEQEWRSAAHRYMAAASHVDDPRAKVRQRHRVKAYEWLLCVSQCLQGICGKTPESYRLHEDPAKRGSPRDWPVLVINADQGSDGYAAHWFLKSQRLPLLFARDDPHRRWNDARL